jgi:hypothetical protein
MVGARVTLGVAGTSTKCGSSFVGQSPLKATQLSHRPLRAAVSSNQPCCLPLMGNTEPSCITVAYSLSGTLLVCTAAGGPSKAGGLTRQGWGCRWRGCM